MKIPLEVLPLSGCRRGLDLSTYSLEVWGPESFVNPLPVHCLAVAFWFCSLTNPSNCTVSRVLKVRFPYHTSSSPCNCSVSLSWLKWPQSSLWKGKPGIQIEHGALHCLWRRGQRCCLIRKGVLLWRHQLFLSVLSQGSFWFSTMLSLTLHCSLALGRLRSRAQLGLK